MNDSLLINAIRFYLRQDWRWRRAGLPSLAQQPDWVEAEVWNRAERAAERLERLRGLAHSQPEPVPVKRRPEASRGAWKA